MKLDLDVAMYFYSIPIAVTIVLFTVGGMFLGYLLCDGYCEILQGSVTIGLCMISFGLCVFLFYLYLPSIRVRLEKREIEKKDEIHIRKDLTDVELDELCEKRIIHHREEVRKEVALEMISALHKSYITLRKEK